MPARVRFPALLPDPPADDRALIGRFAAGRDEGAFAALVRRHGRMVLGVCRRAVGDAHLAEDAFQATFLVLARNPAAATRAASVGGWLFGVARRVGLAARRKARRAGGVGPLIPGGDQGARPPRSPQTDWDDLLRVLDEEVAALPDDCRAAVVACFLREQTQDEAARHLGWSLSTLRRRLDRGKELLRGRLARRGATLGAGLLAGAVGTAAGAAVPGPLAATTLGLAAGDTPSSFVATLAAAGRGPVAGPKILAAAAALLAGGLAVGAARPDAPQPTPGPEAVARVPPPAALTGRIVIPADRPVPTPRPLPRGTGWVKDEALVFAAGPRFHEDILIDPEGRGVANAVVFLRPDGRPLPPARHAPREHPVEARGFRFVPRVLAARAGDTVRFANADPVPHNVRHDGAFNVLLPAGEGHAPGRPLAASRTPDRFRCDIHPWMEGFVWAFDHPYFAVTDAAGRFAIADPPPGPYRLTVWHERTTAATVRPVEVGETGDLGPIVIDPRVGRDEPAE